MDNEPLDANSCFPEDGTWATMNDEEIVNYGFYIDSNNIEGLHFET